jgi:hypothetical protein
VGFLGKQSVKAEAPANETNPFGRCGSSIPKWDSSLATMAFFGAPKTAARIGRKCKKPPPTLILPPFLPSATEAGQWRETGGFFILNDRQSATFYFLWCLDLSSKTDKTSLPGISQKKLAVFFEPAKHSLKKAYF